MWASIAARRFELTHLLQTHVHTRSKVNVRSMSTVFLCTAALFVMNMTAAHAECIW